MVSKVFFLLTTCRHWGVHYSNQTLNWELKYLGFCQTLLKESDCFKILERWIKNQKFYSPEVAELLSSIQYENMECDEFLSGPGESNVLSYKEKYTKLCEIYDNIIQ